MDPYSTETIDLGVDLPFKNTRIPRGDKWCEHCSKGVMSGDQEKSVYTQGVDEEDVFSRHAISHSSSFAKYKIR